MYIGIIITGIVGLSLLLFLLYVIIQVGIDSKISKIKNKEKRNKDMFGRKI